MTEDLTDSESQLIYMLRTSKNFTIDIHADGGRWDIKLQDHDSGVNGDGHGLSFDAAWDDIVDPRLRNAGLRD